MCRLYLVISALVVLLSGCGPKMVNDTRYDLILKLPEASRNYDLAIVDLSDQNDFKYLGNGWHVPGRNGIPVTRFVWSSENVAEVFFDVETVEDKELVFAVRPYVAEGIPPGSLALTFNGTPIGNVRMTDEWRTYRLIIPPDLIHTGPKNCLSIRQSMIHKASDSMIYAEDHRMLGASYSYFVLRKKQSPQPPAMYTLPQILGAGNFVWGGRQRHVIYDTTPASFTWKTDLPSHPSLSFGIGFVPDKFHGDGSDVVFDIKVIDNTGTTHNLFKRVMSPPKRVLEMGWDEYDYDLSRFANQSVEIVLSTPMIDQQAKAVNHGSWLEPRITNKHVPLNVVVISGSGEYPPESPRAGSSHEKMAFMSKKSWEINFSGETNSVFQGIPTDMVDRLVDEAWATGYYYCGYSEEDAEDRFGRKLETVVGSDEVNDASKQEMFDDATGWIKRLDGRNFALFYNLSSSQFQSSERLEELDRLLDWLFAYRFERDSLILLINPGEPARGWLLEPGDLQQEQLDISGWHSLSEYITHDLLSIAS